ncbi:MAG: riboflavin synthase [Pseudomonadota bacterium]
MFTGIILATGTVATITPRGGDVVIRVDCPELQPQRFAEGESIAVSGVCLTALDIDAQGFSADVSRETLDVTALGDWRAGSRVNLEPSLALGDRLGGHLVTGHTDGVATLESRSEDARSLRLRFSASKALLPFIAKKGSVAVAGVSLTVNEADQTGFEVNIIPHTAKETTLGDLAAGDRVNIEVDLIARYAQRLMGFGDAGGITHEYLVEQGYARSSHDRGENQ